MIADSKNKKTRSSFQFGGGVVSGIVIAIILSSLYVKTGLQLPFFLQLTQNIESTGIELFASLMVDEKKLVELQREIAVRISGEPNYYIEIDNALDNFITEEIIWKEKIKRRLMQLQIIVKKMKEVMDSGKFPELESSLKRFLHNIPNSTAEEKYLVYNYLQSRFSGYSDEEIVEALISMELIELLEIPRYPLSRIVFGMGKSSFVKVEIYDKNSRKVKTLIDNQLPAGKYRIYWDYNDDNETRVSADSTYRYKLFMDGHERKTQTIQKPSSVRD